LENSIVMLRYNYKASICSRMAHKFIISATMVLLGAALLDKDRVYFVYNVLSYGEVMLVLYILVYCFVMYYRGENLNMVITLPLKYYSFCFLFFVGWTGISWAINTVFIDGEIHDFFGITVRLAFYYAMTLFVAMWVRRYGPSLIVYPFCGGVFLMFVNNYVNAAMVVGTLPLVIPLTNFSGVLLPVLAMYFALSHLHKPDMVSFLSMLLTYASTILIYSLGAYGFMLTGFPVIWFVWRNYLSSLKTSFVYKMIIYGLMLYCGMYVSVNYNDESVMIIENVSRKYENISFTDTGAQEDQSMDYRIGQLQSSMRMAIENPLFGVGEYNWESENEKNKDWVKAHHTNDNPHNSFAQVVSMYGVPALVFYLFSIYFVFREFYMIHLSTRKMRLLLTVSMVATFLGTAVVMDSFFVTYYFYVFAGIIYGIGSSAGLNANARVSLVYA
jgi:O-antigen ligase